MIIPGTGDIFRSPILATSKNEFKPEKSNARPFPVFILAKMNRTMLMMALGLATGLLGCAEPKSPVGSDADNPVDVAQILFVYAQLTGKTVVASKEVREDTTPILAHQTRPLTRAEACKLIEQDLRDEA